MPPYVYMSSAAVRAHWPTLLADPDNPRPDLATADDFIAAARRGEIFLLGAQLVIQDGLPGKSWTPLFVGLDAAPKPDITAIVAYPEDLVAGSLFELRRGPDLLLRDGPRSLILDPIPPKKRVHGPPRKGKGGKIRRW